MINEKNFESLLIIMGFEKDGFIYKKFFPEFNVELRADFASRRLSYPGVLKGRERNNDFNAPENFVVFECVNRLLEKGYRPEDIELEKEWHLGHEQKSGRADICVSENDAMLFIIECKTWGTEFDKAFKDTQRDGAQLFSYWQQERACKWLVLYSSDFQDDEIIYQAPTINCSDDENFKRLAQNDETIKLFEKASTVPELFDVWQETYESKIHGDLIFSDEAAAYNIEVKPLRKRNLQPIEQNNKIVNQFEEILRHNNVSDKENAFNRLIALFICKLVDETEKSEGSQVDFQYKQGSDTYESLQDRLQKLHSDGMDKFMREKIFYVEANYAERLFSTYKGSNRKNAIRDLNETIRKLKFYSNNDFAFKDVHNEELFIQNGKILVEMVQLFERYKIIYSSRHQLLGDLFEQLLNKGFKQNEGQFFTPIPITRFIWDCLPVGRMAWSEYPKIIDYACGAGHFLTEAIEAVNYFKPCDNNSWARDSIFGIEKDYRLARVAKISLFMNGAGDGNIIFGDGLENYPDKGIENGMFDILVANPPYSVKDFSQYLHKSVKNNFALLRENKIKDNASEIETLFVERIGQLLKPGGIAAVILPSSILSNDSASYTGAREEILKKFYIRAIVAFGSKTFSATGTNTVVMFLERFREPPTQSALYSDSVDSIFADNDLTDWQDEEILEEYTRQINVNPEIYKSFIKRALSIDELNEAEYFKNYVASFAATTEAKKISSGSFSKNLFEDKDDAYTKKFYSYVRAIEKEKILYFALVYHQRTLIIKAPADNKDQKEFLGYDWSDKKGYEGIKIITPGGKLYDDKDRAAEDTLAAAVRKTLEGTEPTLSETQAVYASIANTRDMLDFSRVSFRKAISLTEKKTEEIASKYPARALENLLISVSGSTNKVPKDSIKVHGSFPVITQEQGVLISGYVDNVDPVTDLPLVVFGDHTCVFKYVDFQFIRGADGTQLLKTDENILKSKYLYYYLQTVEIENRNRYERHMKYLKTVPIPLPPLDVQAKIVSECQAVDDEYNQTRMSIENYRKKIGEVFEKLDMMSGRVNFSLDDSEKFSVSIGKRVLNKNLVENGSVPVYSANVFEPFGYVDELLITDFSVDSVLWGIDGDWMVNFMPAGREFYPTDHCGVLRCKTEKVNPRYMAHILETEGKRLEFSRSYRASIDRVQGIKFSVPDVKVQNKAAEEIKVLESKIVQAEKKLEGLKGRTKEILEGYLR